MAKIAMISLANLLIDTDNPRIEETLQNQREYIRAVAANQKGKLATLAKDIVENGLNPSDLLIVMPFAEDEDRYVVLEGNRRVTALKVLENPELISGAVDEAVVNRLKKESAHYCKSPIEWLQCVVVEERADANHWIELRHTGENEGAGIVRWGGSETARFRQRSGQKEPHLQVLDFLEKRGELENETRQNVPVTSLKRLLGTRYVRIKLGIDLKAGTIGTRIDSSDEIAKGLKRIVDDLASGTIRTKDIYRLDDRTKYIDGLPPEDLPDISTPRSEFRPLPSPSISQIPPSQRKRSVPSQKNRTTLIQRGFRLTIRQPRTNEIYHELRKLNLKEYPNAIAVLFRVFLELSVDTYLDQKQLAINANQPLNKKLLKVATDLKEENKMNDQQLKPVRRAAQADSFLASTITTMHQYVHNPHFSPAPSDLRAAWDNLQTFLEAIWDL